MKSCEGYPASKGIDRARLRICTQDRLVKLFHKRKKVQIMPNQFDSNFLFFLIYMCIFVEQKDENFYYILIHNIY